MRLSPIVLKLRLANTDAFESRVTGVADLATAFMATLTGETAFVIPMSDVAEDNRNDTGLNQKLDERFGVVLALKNDTSQADQLGVGAFDRIHDIRADIWKAILGWIVPGTEDLIYYKSGRLLGFNRAYLWWQLEFVTKSRIEDDDGIDMEDADDFNTIYAQLEMTPSANIPIHEGIPVTSFTPDMTIQVDLTENPEDGAFDRSFGLGFDLYTGAW